MSKKTSPHHRLRQLLTLFYLLLIGAQLAIEFNAWKLGRLHQHMAQDSESTIYLAYSQPLMWCFTLLTLVIFIDMLRNKTATLTSIISIFIVLVISTVFLQLFIMLAGYVPVLEMNTAG